MFSSSAPQTPRRKSSEQFNEMVRDLNEKYHLELNFVDSQLTPKQRREIIKEGGPDSERLENIWKRLRYHFFDKNDPLSPLLHHFHQAAAQIRQDWARRARITGGIPHTTRLPNGHASSPSLISREEVVELQEKLLGLLMSSPQSPATLTMTQSFDSKLRTPLPAVANTPKLAKRSSNDMPLEYSVKRARNSLHGPGSLNVPIRPNNAFSASESRQPGSAFAISSEDEYDTAPESPSARYTPSFASTSSRPPRRLSTIRFRDTPSHYSDVSSESSSSVPSSPSIRAPFDVMDSLRKVWPVLPWCLTHAPLGVCWEVTRIALHCKVPLEQLHDLVYDQSWHDQDTMRKILHSHPLFRGKTLPPPCRPAAWEASLSTFQQHDGMAMSLAITLTWSGKKNGPLFHVSLQPLKLELSHRLGRRFGADRFLELNIPTPTAKGRPRFINADEGKAIVDWIATTRHYIVGRFWGAFWVRNQKKKEKQEDKKRAETNGVLEEENFSSIERVYCFAVDGNSFTKSNMEDGLPTKEEATLLGVRSKVKLADMLDWALSIRILANQQQPTLKLFSRLALSLSRTRDALVIEPDQIRHRVEDIMSPTGNVMNDGIARMSTALVKRISEHLGLDEIPSAFQGRFGSAKGLWIRDVEDMSDDLWIETYPSQRKWECDFQDVGHRSFDVKAYPRPLKSADVNLQFIVVLCARARDQPLMREVISGFLKKWLEEEVEQQRAAMNDPVLLAQWVHDNFFNGYRAARSTGSVEFLGGLPNAEAEMLNFLLAAGFHPRKQKFLQELFWKLAERKAENLKNNLKIRFPRSTYAFMTVDFQGVLQPGEVHLMFSSKFKVDNNPQTLLNGFDVLVARAPAHFPSDIQRVKAVFRPELAMLKDVIVFPRTGNEPLADLLSGGDYDGDLAWVCWEPSIVENFENARVTDPPDLMKLGYLRKAKGTFGDILEETSHNFDNAVSRLVSDGFSFNMQDQMLGICTSHKESYCYKTGRIDDEGALLLSSLLSALVDQAKQGIVFGWQDWFRLQRERKLGDGLRKPAYKAGGRPIGDNILDHLKFQVAIPMVKQHLVSFRKFLDAGAAQPFDADLVRHAHKLERDELKDVRMQLEFDLDDLYSDWRRGDGAYEEKTQMLYDRWRSIQPLKEHPKNLILQAILGTDETLQHHEWLLMKASKTFQRFYKTAPRFAWTMAGRELQYLKGLASLDDRNGRRFPGTVAVTMPLYASLRPDKTLVSARAAMLEGREDDSSFGEVEFDAETGVQVDDT